MSLFHRGSHSRAERLDIDHWGECVIGWVEQREAARAVQFVRQVAGAWHDVDMHVLEVVGLGESGEILFRAAGLRVERPHGVRQQRAHLGELVGGQLVQGGGVTTEDEHEPAHQRCRPGMVDDPIKPVVDMVGGRDVSLAA